MNNSKIVDEKMYLYQMETGVVIALTEAEHNRVESVTSLNKQPSDEFIGCYVRE